MRLVDPADLPAPLAALCDAWAARPDVDALRDGPAARTACWQASKDFADHLAQHAIRAQPWGSWASELGFAQRAATPWPQDDSHVVCVVWHEDRIVSVDWTASQYARTETFPLVHELDELPPKDPWLLTPEQAEQAMQQIQDAVRALGDADPATP